MLSSALEVAHSLMHSGLIKPLSVRSYIEIKILQSKIKIFPFEKWWFWGDQVGPTYRSEQGRRRDSTVASAEQAAQKVQSSTIVARWANKNDDFLSVFHQKWWFFIDFMLNNEQAGWSARVFKPEKGGVLYLCTKDDESLTTNDELY